MSQISRPASLQAFADFCRIRTLPNAKNQGNLPCSWVSVSERSSASHPYRDVRTLPNATHHATRCPRCSRGALAFALALAFKSERFRTPLSGRAMAHKSETTPSVMVQKIAAHGQTEPPRAKGPGDGPSVKVHA
jgi:hypothetical protein